MDNVFNLFSTVINCLFCILALVIFIGIFIRVFKGRVSKTVELPAVVVNKQRYEKEVYSKMAIPKIKRECIVTFLCGSKRLSFEVSEYSYDGLELNQEGILTYKGSQFLDFKAENTK